MNFQGIDYQQMIDSIKGSFVFFPSLEDDRLFNGRRVYLRHDVDNDLWDSVRMSIIEKSMNIRSTYFLLNQAPYWKTDMSGAIELILSGGHEIGWHNNAVQEWMLDGKVKPLRHYINEPLNELRNRYRLKIRGTAAHGVLAPWDQTFRNYNCFDIKYKYKSLIPLDVFTLHELGLDYECSKIRQDIHLTDSSNRWNSDPKETIARFNDMENCTMQINIHPQWWKL